MQADELDSGAQSSLKRPIELLFPRSNSDIFEKKTKKQIIIILSTQNLSPKVSVRLRRIAYPPACTELYCLFSLKEIGSF
jgi:hypothetical protein